MKKKYDFAGWVTKKDVQCLDGITIRHDAFKDCDGVKVPLVWDHNYASPENVVGHIVLEKKQEGMYGYGYLNDTAYGVHAKAMIQHGDITALSIGARNLKKQGQNLIHGIIYEVSLVLAGANPGAFIDEIVTHSDKDGMTAVLYTDAIIHSAETLPEEEQELENEETIGDVLSTLNDKQKEAVASLIGSLVDDEIEENEENEEKGDTDTMRQNVFSNNNEETLQHSVDTKAIIQSAIKSGSLKDAVLKHGITNIETLFPEAHMTTNEPMMMYDRQTAAEAILNAIHKSPFSRIKTHWADLTEEDARARGYIKGNQKLEQIFSLANRVTTPQTIYKKQKLDRDDIVDITDFNVVDYINREMRIMIRQEIARAVLVGDGRVVSSPDKIKEEYIRPIITDTDFFTLKAEFDKVENFIETVVRAMATYEGSGVPTMYIDKSLLTSIKLLKKADGSFLTGSIPKDTELAEMMGVDSIVATSFMTGKGAVIVNLKDYTLGATKGGELTTFDDFDIDFNQYKYLIETRLSGSLTVPRSAVYVKPKAEPGE